jgi:cytoskeletal protein CcmA (bactofilin family)
MLGKKSVEEYRATGDSLNTLIGKGSVFEGSLKVQSTLRVDGKVRGNITTSDSLVVGKEGDIDGEMKVRNAIVGGKLKGKLIASGKVVLEANSVFNGELKANKLVIEEGAVFEGNCSMGSHHNAEAEGIQQKGVATILEKKPESEMKVAK